MQTFRLLNAALTLLLAALASSSAHAITRTLTCGAFSRFANATGSTLATCLSITSGASKTLTDLNTNYDFNSATLSYTTDYDFGTAANNNVAFSFNTGGPSGVTWLKPSTTVNVSGALNSGSFTQAAPVTSSVTAGLSFSNFGSNFDVAIGSLTTQGGALTSSGLATITYRYTPVVGGSPISATVNCGSIRSFINANGNAVASCPSVTAATGKTLAELADYNLTEVTLGYYADFGFGTAFNNNVALTFTTGSPAGVTWSNPSRTLNVTGPNPTPLLNPVATGLSFNNFASNFTVSFDSLPTQGGAAYSSAIVSVIYDYSLKSPVPEPAAAGLFGLGLAGVMLARRRRAC
jgi:PEP-CTERM motif